MKKVNLFFVSLVALVTLSVGFSSCGGGSGSSNSSISSIEDLKGKTWQYTQSGAQYWFKLKINNDNTFEGWTASPSDGKWGNPVTGSYSVMSTEQRDIENGRQIFMISLGNVESTLKGLRYLIIYKGDTQIRFASNPSYYDPSFVVANQTDANPWN